MTPPARTGEADEGRLTQCMTPPARTGEADEGRLTLKERVIGLPRRFTLPLKLRCANRESARFRKHPGIAVPHCSKVENNLARLQARIVQRRYLALKTTHHPTAVTWK